MNIDYTLWTNTDGNLGEIKVQIPDGVATTWPEGDALVGNFVYKNGLLSGFVDTKALTVNESKSTVINYDYIDIELPFTEGEIAITRGERSKYFNVRYNPVNGLVLICFEDMDTDTKALLRSATKIIDNTLYDKDDNVIGTFDTNSLKTASNVAVKIDEENGSVATESTDGKDLDSLFKSKSWQTTSRNPYPISIFESDLKSLTSGNYMFINSLLARFDSDLSNMTEAYRMFDSSYPLTSFNANLDNLICGDYMFSLCRSLTSFDVDMPELIYGGGMFSQCYNFTSFTANVPNLKEVSGMFRETAIETFDVEIPKVTSAYNMFYGCSKLVSITSDLSKLEHGPYMFQNCSSLTSFNKNLSSLIKAPYMFQNCSKLTSFNCDLSSLVDGAFMFAGCKLDTPSVQNIADKIGTYIAGSGSGRIDIGIGHSTVNEEEDAAFKIMASKGWAIFVNGAMSPTYYPTSSTMTLDELDNEVVTPIPYYAKPVQTDEEHARYVDENGNFFDILGAQFIYGDDLSTYGIFTSEEDAAANMRLTKIC